MKSLIFGEAIKIYQLQKYMTMSEALDTCLRYRPWQVSQRSADTVTGLKIRFRTMPVGHPVQQTCECLSESINIGCRISLTGRIGKCSNQ